MTSYVNQLRTCSEVFQHSMFELQQQGVSYYDDQAYHAAREAIETFVPDIVAMSGERVGIEAELGMAHDGVRSLKFGGVAVKAVLRSVQIRELHEFIEEDGLSIELVRADLCGLFVPLYTDPEPVELVLNDELYVPFGAVNGFEPL